MADGPIRRAPAGMPTARPLAAHVQAALAAAQRKAAPAPARSAPHVEAALQAGRGVFQARSNPHPATPAPPAPHVRAALMPPVQAAPDRRLPLPSPPSTSLQRGRAETLQRSSASSSAVKETVAPVLKEVAVTTAEKKVADATAATEEAVATAKKKSRPSKAKRKKTKDKQEAAESKQADQDRKKAEDAEREEFGFFFPNAQTGGVQAQGVLTLTGEAKPYDSGLQKNGAEQGSFYYAWYATFDWAKRDAEVKVLSALTSQLGDKYKNGKIQTAGVLKLRSTQGPCTSCQAVIAQFKTDHPNVTIRISYGGDTAQVPNRDHANAYNGYADATKTALGRWLKVL